MRVTGYDLIAWHCVGINVKGISSHIKGKLLEPGRLQSMRSTSSLEDCRAPAPSDVMQKDVEAQGK